MIWPLAHTSELCTCRATPSATGPWRCSSSNLPAKSRHRRASSAISPMSRTKTGPSPASRWCSVAVNSTKAASIHGAAPCFPTNRSTPSTRSTTPGNLVSSSRPIALPPIRTRAGFRPPGLPPTRTESSAFPPGLGPAEIETLAEARQLLHDGGLRRGLHALYRHAQADFVHAFDDGPQHFDVAAARGHVPQKQPVQLDAVQRQLFEAVQAGKTGEIG